MWAKSQRKYILGRNKYDRTTTVTRITKKCKRKSHFSNLQATCSLHVIPSCCIKTVYNVDTGILSSSCYSLSNKTLFSCHEQQSLWLVSWISLTQNLLVQNTGLRNKMYFLWSYSENNSEQQSWILVCCLGKMCCPDSSTPTCFQW